MLGDMNVAMDNMRDLMREKFGDQMDAAFEQWDREAAELQAKTEEEAEAGPSTEDEERDRRRAERARKRAARLARGQFPSGVGAAPGANPTAAQEAAFRFLTENERAVHDAVLAEVWDSFAGAYGQEHWRRIAGIKPAESVADSAPRSHATRLHTRVARRSRTSSSTSIPTGSDEHGRMIVYCPTREAAWTSWDGLYDLTESDEPAAPGTEYVPSPHDELLEAISDRRRREGARTGRGRGRHQRAGAGRVPAAVDRGRSDGGGGGPAATRVRRGPEARQ